MKRLLILLTFWVLPAFAQTSVATGTFTAPTLSTAAIEVNITGAFQPRVVCMWTTYPGTAVDGADNYSLSFGCMTDEATDQQRGIWMGCDQAIDASDCNQIMYDDKVARVYNGGTTLVGDLGMTTFDSDGFTVTPADAFTTDTVFGYWALGGADITDASLDTIARGTGTGQYSTTAPGFQPDFLMLFSTSGGASVNSTAASAFFNIGFTDGEDAALMSTEALDAVTTSDTRQYTRSGSGQLEIWALTVAATDVSNRDSFVSFNVTGFTLDAIENSGTSRSLFALTIKGGQWHVGDLLSLTSLADITETGSGFTPKGLVFIQPARASTTQNTLDASTAQASMSIGAAQSATSRFAMTTTGTDNDAQNDAYFNNQLTDKIQARYDTANALLSDIDFKTFDADGFTLTQEDADAAQFFCIYFIVGDNAAVTGQKRQRRFRW